MAKVKIQGNASGTGVLTVTAPNTSTDRTITLPDSTGTLATTDDNGSQLDHSGSKKIEATATGVDVTGIAVTDGITSSGNITFDNGNSSVSIKSDGANGSYIQFGSNEYLRFLYDNGASESIRLIDGGGITFNGDTAAANALDDYEEGTCTIQYSDGTNVVGDANLSKYTKVGRLVTVTGYLNVTNIDSLSNGLSIRLTGFPFTNTTDTTFPYFSRFWDMPTGTINTVGYLPLGQTHCTFYAMKDNASYQQITCGDVGNSNDLYFGVSYHAS